MQLASRKAAIAAARVCLSRVTSFRVSRLNVSLSFLAFGADTTMEKLNKAGVLDNLFAGLETFKEVVDYERHALQAIAQFRGESLQAY